MDYESYLRMNRPLAYWRFLGAPILVLVGAIGALTLPVAALVLLARRYNRPRWQPAGEWPASRPAGMTAATAPPPDAPTN